MLGEMVGEETGKITGTRVLQSGSGAPKLETSIQTAGTLYGVEETAVATYTAEMRPDGSLYGDGQGVTMAKDGGAATWSGQGIGRLTPNGGVSWRGAVIVQSATGSLAHVNSRVIVFEFETDANQNTHSRSWEWK